MNGRCDYIVIGTGESKQWFDGPCILNLPQRPCRCPPHMLTLVIERRYEGFDGLCIPNLPQRLCRCPPHLPVNLLPPKLLTPSMHARAFERRHEGLDGPCIPNLPQRLCRYGLDTLHITAPPDLRLICEQRHKGFDGPCIPNLS